MSGHEGYQTGGYYGGAAQATAGSGSYYQQQQQQQYGDYASPATPSSATTAAAAAAVATAGSAYTDPYAGAANPYGQQQQQQAPAYNTGAAATATATATGGYDYGNHAGGYPQQQQQYADGVCNNDVNSISNDYSSCGAQADPNNNHHHHNASNMQSLLAAPNAVDASGLRWTWSAYPNTAKPKTKDTAVSAASIPLPEMVIPLACMYAPLLPLPLECMVVDNPLTSGGGGQQVCGSCGAFWSRHSYREERPQQQGGTVSGGGGSWVCMSCQRRNQLPHNFSPDHPAMLHDTVEYIIPDDNGGDNNTNGYPGGSGSGSIDDLKHPAFIFVIDTCLPHEEMAALKEQLLRCLAWLPPRSLVGFIAYGARTTVWELNTAATAGLSKCYALRGDTAYTTDEMPLMLQVSDGRPVRGRFLCPLQDCRPVLADLIMELQPDGAPQRSSRRPLRTTGTAVSVATFLMESLRHDCVLRQQQHHHGAATPAAAVSGSSPVKTAGKILLFTGGPCTRGVGMAVGTDRAEMMRFHRDIIEGDTPYYEKAYATYNDLDARLAAVDGCLDVFAHSYDQVGVMEMRNCVNNTGGSFVCGDAFDHENFGKSLKRYFERCDLRIKDRYNSSGNGDNGDDDATSSFIVRCAFSVHIEVHTSADTLVSGILGPSNVDTEANKAAKVHRQASPLQIGVGGTTRWCVSSIDQGVALAILFDTATLDGPAISQTMPGGGGPSQAHHQHSRFVQIVTRYVSPNGQRRIRVTSHAQPIAPAGSLAEFFVQNQCFDQTCASTVIARMAVSILEKFPSCWDDAKRWVDTLLVRFVRRYGSFNAGQPESLRLDRSLSLFPSFMFNLRRSEYFLVLNISPDETTFKRHWLMRDTVDNCVLMIQPTLDSYDLEAPYAQPVPLDSSSLRADNIVLMDAFFNVHVMWGTTIYEWIEAKYHELPDYAHFAELLERAEADAQAVLARRYPYPRFSRTSANGSEARHVKTRVNPATTHHQQPSGGYNNGGIMSMGGQHHQPNTGGGEQRSDLIYTDDASISKFMASLKQAVVAPEPKEPGTGAAGSVASVVGAVTAVARRG